MARRWILNHYACFYAAATAGMIALSACGTQINSLESKLRNRSGASGVPPEVTSLLILDSSPTRSIPLTLDWGIQAGDAEKYCLLENSQDSTTCVWLSTPLPTTYADSAADGPLTLTVFLKNDFGTSIALDSNTVTIDRTRATLASATVTNVNPTNSATFALSYGAVSDGPYAHYCIRENSTVVAGCSWIAGALPATYNVSATDGSKELSIWLRDAAGNVSLPVTTAAIVYDGSVPLVAISTPAAGSYVNAANGASFPVTGTCSETGRSVVITGDASATVACVGGAWTANLDFSAAAAGSVSITVNHNDAAGNVAVAATRSFVKDIVVPTVAISSPAANSYIGAASVASFAVSGTCSENGRNVVVSGDAAATVACSAGTWTANLDFSAAAAGSVSISVNHADAAGNPAATASRTFIKDVSAPTVAISAPAAGSYVNAASVASFGVNGTCSENGRGVVITGDASATVSCGGGVWTANLDFSAAAAGTVSISVNHSDAAGNAATAATRSFVKDVVVPTVAITAPAANSYITAASVASFAVTGTCSETGRDVVISGDAAATVSCLAGTWSANLDFTAAAAGTVTIAANHADAAGNPAVASTRSFIKDVSAPTIAITSPAAGSYVSAANVASFTVSGTCSDSGQNVVISGDAAATVVCTAGAWTTNLDFTSAAAGSVSIAVNHSDSAGNAATPATRSFTKDVTVPTVAISTPAANSVINAGNVASFAVTGTCSENGQNVVITGDAAATVACAAGAWSANLDFSGAAAGAVSITVNHSDAAGNPATPATRAFVKDTSLPTIAISSPAANSYMNSSSVASFPVSGTCSENGENVVISGDASATVACAAGAWSTNLNFSAAASGTVSIAVNHSDSSGNAALTASRSFTKDVTAPTVAISTPAANSGVNAANVASFAVTGTCSENTLNVVISGDAAATVACAAGAWSANLDFTAAAAGTVSISVAHSDAAGNAATPATRSFTKDVTVPTVAISTPAANSYINAASVASYAVTGTCSENTRDVVISGDASATVSCAAGAWTANLDFTSAAAGTVSITVNHTDAAGNPATAATRSFVKDATAPTIAISAPAANSYVNAASVAAFGISGTCSENGRDVVITGDASATVSCTAGAWSANLDFTSAAAGNVSISVAHGDAAGNSATPATRTFIKDVVAPTLAISAPAANSPINSASVASFAVNGTCSENGQNVVISGDASATVACSAGAWTANLDFTSAASGTVTIQVNHSDAAGNPAGAASRPYIKDVTVPTVAISLPAANSYINAASVTAHNVSGTCSENTRDVVITGDASATVACTAGAWNANLNFSGAAEGSVSITVNHSDAAGNIASADTRSFVKDVTLPTVAGTSPANGSYINAASAAAFVVSGTCSENTRNVVVSGAASATVVCSSGGWSASLDFSAAAAGSHTIYVNHSDAAGNPATQDSGTFVKDVTSPTVTISSTATNPTLTAAMTITVTFNESVTGFTQADLSVGNATISSFAGSGTTYTFTATATTYGNVTVDIAAGVAADAAGNPNTVASQLLRMYGLVVSAAYPTNGANWNSYVRYDGADNYSATGVACDGSEAQISSCIHGGEIRKIAITGVASCAGLSMTDTLGAFNWTCKVEGGVATFYSSGIKTTRGLRDLVDATSWKSNRVTLAGGPAAQSVTTTWWTNPVVALPDNSAPGAGSIVLDGTDGDGAGPDAAHVAGTVFTLATSRATQGYVVGLDRTAVVTLSGATLSYGGDAANNCSDATGEAGSTHRCVITSGAQKFLWIEGTFSGEGGVNDAHFAVFARGALFSRLYRMSVTASLTSGLVVGSDSYRNSIQQITANGNPGDGVTLGSVEPATGGTSGSNLVETVSAIGNGSDGFFINESHSNSVRYLNGHANGSKGLSMINSGGNTIKDSRFSANTASGVGVAGSGTLPNIFGKINSSNNSGNGFVLWQSNGNMLTSVVATGNTVIGIYLGESSNNVVSHATFVNNVEAGYYLESNSLRNTGHSILTGNTKDGAGMWDFNDYNTVSHLLATHSVTGAYTHNSENNNFLGLLMMGNNSWHMCGSTSTTSGVVDNSCTVSGTDGSSNYPAGYASTALLRTGRTLASTFNAKVVTNDSGNTSDSSGAAAAFPGTPASFDWSSFDDALFRNWGKDGSAFPNANHQGAWTSGAGRIWDWKIAPTDTVVRNRSRNGSTPNEIFVLNKPCPHAVHGNVAVTDQMTPTPNTYLLNAREIMEDGYGDEDGLCESSERCVYSPHLGAYQGEGSFTVCQYQDSGDTALVDNVQMYAYASEVSTPTFYENFNSGSLTAGLWTTWGDTPMFSIVDGKAHMQVRASVASASSYHGFYTAAGYDMTDKAAYIEMNEALNPIAANEVLFHVYGSTRIYSIIYSGSTITARIGDYSTWNDYGVTNYPVAGPVMTSFRFARLRHSTAMNRMYFEVSPDMATWTVLHDFAPIEGVGNVLVGVEAGNWQATTPSGAGTAKIEQVWIQ